MDESTHGIATFVNVKCSKNKLHNFTIKRESQCDTLPGNMSLEMHVVNVLVYLVTIFLGIGLEGLSKVSLL